MIADEKVAVVAKAVSTGAGAWALLGISPWAWVAAFIGAVASYYGYSDVFFFSRQFKAVVGVAPGQWRQRER